MSYSEKMRIKAVLLSVLICTISFTALAEQAVVIKVIDGDTLKLTTAEMVSLIGIDTPEMYASIALYQESERRGQDIETILARGRQAYQFTKELAEGKEVRLEFDIQKYDEYGRLMAYVYLTDETFVNAEIIKQGYAKPLNIPPNVKYADLFNELYQEALKNKRGLW